MTNSQQPQAAVIEIIESGRASDDTGAGSMIVPREVRINGQSVLTPKGTRVKVHDFALGDELITVTLTVIARRVTIAAEGDLPDNTLCKEQS